MGTDVFLLSGDMFKRVETQKEKYSRKYLCLSLYLVQSFHLFVGPLFPLTLSATAVKERRDISRTCKTQEARKLH